MLEEAHARTHARTSAYTTGGGGRADHRNETKKMEGWLEGSARALIRSNRKGKGTRDSPSAVPSLPHSFSPYSSERYSLRKMEHIVVYMCVHILLYHHRRLYYIDHSPAQPSTAQPSTSQPSPALPLRLCLTVSPTSSRVVV